MPCTALVDRRPRRPDPLHRELEIVERVGFVAGRVLDREPGDPGGRGQLHVLGDALRLDRETALEIGVDRHRDRRRDRPEMGERLVERDPVVAPAQGPGEAGAGRRQRREAELLERARTPCIPRIGHDETAGGVKAMKGDDAGVRST